MSIHESAPEALKVLDQEEEIIRGKLMSRSLSVPEKLELLGRLRAISAEKKPLIAEWNRRTSEGMRIATDEFIEALNKV